MGTPRNPGQVRQGSLRFAEMVANAPIPLPIAAALYPEVSAALDIAQADEDFVRFVIDMVDARQEAEDAFFAGVDPETDEA